MKKAIIETGGKQYFVSEGETLKVELLHTLDQANVTFQPLLVIDDKIVTVGAPIVDGVKVTATVITAELKADKVTAIRFKAKKRVNKVHGHRQKQTVIKIDKIV